MIILSMTGQCIFCDICIFGLSDFIFLYHGSGILYSEYTFQFDATSIQI